MRTDEPVGYAPRHIGGEPIMANYGTTVVIEASGVYWASSKAVNEAVLSRRPGGSPWTQTRCPRPRPSPTPPARTSPHGPGGRGIAATTAPGNPSRPRLRPPRRNPPMATRTLPVVLGSMRPIPPVSPGTSQPTASTTRTGCPMVVRGGNARPRTQWATVGITAGSRWTTWSVPGGTGSWWPRCCRWPVLLWSPIGREVRWETDGVGGPTGKCDGWRRPPGECFDRRFLS